MDQSQETSHGGSGTIRANDGIIMFIDMKVELVGLKRMVTRVSNVSLGIARDKLKWALEVAQFIHDDIVTNIAVDTAAMQKSTRIQIYPDITNELDRIEVTVGGYVINPKTGKIVDYPVHVEFGTSKMKAQPFMRPARERAKGMLLKKAHEGIRRM